MGSARAIDHRSVEVTSETNGSFILVAVTNGWWILVDRENVECGLVSIYLKKPSRRRGVVPKFSRYCSQ